MLIEIISNFLQSNFISVYFLHCLISSKQVNVKGKGRKTMNINVNQLGTWKRIAY